MTDRVKVEVSGGVAEVRLCRPDKLNALDPAMFAGLVDAGEQVMRTPGIRAVVLSGEGRAFSAGLDFLSFAAEGKGSNLFSRNDTSPANRAQRAAWIWQEVPVPVVAAIQGAVFGGGLQIALGADLRYASPDAQLSVMEIRWGLVPDMSGTQALRRLVRLDVAKELTFTGRVVLAEEALALGLVTRIADDPRGAALETAKDIAAKSPDAVRAAKKVLNASALLSLEDGFKLEEELQRRLLGSPNQLEAVAANFEKRPPRFRDPGG